MSDLLSILEMAVGFLSMAGGDPETKICDYLKNVLRLSDGKSNLKSKKVGNISSSYVFLEGTVTNPAISLVLYPVSIFLSLPTGHGNAFVNRRVHPNFRCHFS